MMLGVLVGPLKFSGIVVVGTCVLVDDFIEDEAAIGVSCGSVTVSPERRAE